MSAIKIGIVEDEGITSEVIKVSLQKLKYKVAKPAFTYNQAVQMFEAEKPDLVILDIKLGEEKDGIDLAKLLKEKYQTPFIFLTANSDITTLNKAKKVRPSAFLVKPFSQIDLHASIEIAISNHQTQNIETKTQSKFVMMKVGRSFEKVDKRIPALRAAACVGRSVVAAAAPAPLRTTPSEALLGFSPEEGQ